MFYERFAEICDINKISPSKAATMCGFNKGSVSFWKKKSEDGEDIRPSKEIIDKIVDYFDVSESWLLGLDVEEHPSVIIDNMSPAKKKLLESVEGMDEKQILKLISVIAAVREME